MTDPLDRDIPLTREEGDRIAAVLLDLHVVIDTQTAWEIQHREGRYKGPP